MSKKSTTTFKDLVNSPIGIIAEYITNKLSLQSKYEPLKNFIDEIQTGKTPPMSEPKYYSSKDMEWIKPSDIGFDKYILGSDWISNSAIKDNKATIYKPGTILIICIGGGIGRLGIVDKACSSNQQITGILFNKNIVPEFAYYFFLSRYKIFEENSSKSTLPIINQKGLGNLGFICPKIEVQQEVVRLLDYCKECLDNLSYPSLSDWNLNKDILDFTNKTFKMYYAQKNLQTELSHQLTLIENLNQAILQEAVQGKLLAKASLKHEKNNETGQQLLERIKAEKAKSFPLRGNKKGATFPPIKPEEIPFEIPENWVWCRLREICYITSGSTPSKDAFVEDGIPFLKMYNLRNQEIDFNYKPQYIKADVHNGQLKRCRAYSGDVIMNIVGPPLGKIAIIPESLPECNFNQAAVLIRPMLREMNRYIFWYLNEMSEIKAIDTKGIAGQDNISVTQSQSIKIPLPPLSEQKLIVAEIERQLAKTKALKAQIASNQANTEALLKALLSRAFEVV